MKIGVVAVVAALASTSCYTRPSQPTICQGVLNLAGISEPRARQDATRTIIQFIALDEKVVLTKSDPDHLYIRATGDSCREFARSFTASEIPVFRGLTYDEIGLGTKGGK